MFIHKTHSKKDLCNIIKTFNIKIEEPEKLRKKDLIKEVISEFRFIDEIEPELEYYMFYNLVDLKSYLYNCNPKKILSIKEKNNVILTCKRIQQYIFNSYSIDHSSFNDVNEIHKVAKYIEPYGDIPSVRRACKGLNDCPNKIFKLNPNISKQTARELEKKAEYKKKYEVKITVEFGKFLITFD